MPVILCKSDAESGDRLWIQSPALHIFVSRICLFCQIFKKEDSSLTVHLIDLVFLSFISVSELVHLYAVFFGQLRNRRMKIDIFDLHQKRNHIPGRTASETVKKLFTISAAMEGGMTFCLGVWKKHKQGKRLSEFTAEDWKDIGIDTTKGSVQGAIRGGTVYAMTNFTATPAAVANAFVTAAFGVTGQGIKFRRGEISAEEFVENSEILCLDVSISAVSAMLGQVAIPIPVLGAMIGNVAGMFMYQIAKDNLSEKEQILIQAYQESFAALNQTLDERYYKLLAMLKKEMERFSSMLELAFDPDVNIAFDGSIVLADYVGVTPKKVLRNKRDIDQYFLN